MESEALGRVDHGHHHRLSASIRDFRIVPARFLAEGWSAGSERDYFRLSGFPPTDAQIGIVKVFLNTIAKRAVPSCEQFHNLAEDHCW